MLLLGKGNGREPRSQKDKDLGVIEGRLGRG